MLSPNPFVAGGARWNVMAAYGSQIKQGKTPDEANAFVETLIRNIVVQPKSAREMLQAFVEGKGDVALDYENEAITAQQKGEDVDYVVPDQTILIENPIAAIKGSKSEAAAKAFVDYARTAGAQRIYAQKGYRPVDEAVLGEFADTFPTPTTLFTIADLGGWPELMQSYFDKDAGVLAGIYKKLGVPTDG